MKKWWNRLLCRILGHKPGPWMRIYSGVCSHAGRRWHHRKWEAQCDRCGVFYRIKSPMSEVRRNTWRSA